MSTTEAPTQTDEDTRQPADEASWPDTPAEALKDLDFQAEDLEAHLDGAHEELYSHVEGENLGADRRLELTFRTYTPADDGVYDYNMRDGGEWMQYPCALTGMDVAVRLGAPVPVVAIYEATRDGSDSVIRCLKIHPDLLKDRRRLFEMLVWELEEAIHAGIYEARLAHSLLGYLSGRDDVPGRPTEGVTYPRDQGYKPLGNRPLDNAE